MNPALFQIPAAFGLAGVTGLNATLPSPDRQLAGEAEIKSIFDG